MKQLLPVFIYILALLFVSFLFIREARADTQPVLLFYYNRIQSGDTSPEVLRDYIVSESLLTDVDPQLLLGIASAESRLNPDAVGDHGTSYGLYQIHLPAHPHISKQEALDPIWSTQWAINEMRKNGCKAWSTCKGVTNQLRASQPLAGIKKWATSSPLDT